MNIAENIMSSKKNFAQKNISGKRNRNLSYDAADKNHKIIGDFKLGEKLGEGTFGKVRLAMHMITKEKVIIIRLITIKLK